MIEAPSEPPSSDRSVPRLLSRFEEVSPPHGSAGAAVLIVLREGTAEPEVLLIERALREGDPASGQIGLPGGRVDDGEGALVQTALRECREEVGIGPGDLTGMPRFVGFANASAVGLRVGVFAAELGPAGRPPTAESPTEVAHVFWMPRSVLSVRRRLPRETISGTREVDATLIDRHVLWGFTRRVLLDFFQVQDEEPAA